MSTAVLGLQWGDEGKGKITHLLARDADMVVRFNGGPNAGHTVIDRGVKFGTHLIPAGAFYPQAISVLAGGVVIDLAVLREEVDAVAKHAGRAPKLLIAENAHLILPYHRLLEELEGSGSHFGTTRRGISPAYRDKAGHLGVRAGDLLFPERLRERLAWRVALLKRQWSAAAEVHEIDADRLADDVLELAEPLLGSIGDATAAIQRALDDNKNVLFEGAQGALLDVDHGTYPFVTSSPTTFAGLGNGIGIPAPNVARRLGVLKAYTTRVGEGPFPTELAGEIGESFRDRGGEFGVTTGRPRRCGWLDAVAVRHAVALNGLTGIALTKIDVLAGTPEIQLCRAYRLSGQEIDRFPLSGETLAECEPIYESFDGWSESLDRVESYDALPAAARAYIEKIEEFCGVPVELVSVGPRPEETISRML